MAVVTVKVRRGLLTLFCLWVGFGVSLVPYRPVAASTPTVHHTGHMSSPAKQSTEPKPVPEPAHHHGPRCVLCLVGAGTLPALVRIPKGVRLERAEPLPLLPGVRPRPFRLFRSRAPPPYGRVFNLPF